MHPKYTVWNFKLPVVLVYEYWFWSHGQICSWKLFNLRQKLIFLWSMYRPLCIAHFARRITRSCETTFSCFQLIYMASCKLEAENTSCLEQLYYNFFLHSHRRCHAKFYLHAFPCWQNGNWRKSKIPSKNFEMFTYTTHIFGRMNLFQTFWDVIWFVFLSQVILSYVNNNENCLNEKSKTQSPANVENEKLSQ